MQNKNQHNKIYSSTKSNKKTSPLAIDNNQIESAKHAAIFGLNLTTHGYTKHIKEIKQKPTLLYVQLGALKNKKQT